jgi:hypothetical protein
VGHARSTTAARMLDHCNVEEQLILDFYFLAELSF